MFLDDFDRVQDLNITCPICGKPDWCCLSVTGETVLCQRIESGVKFGDAGHIHILDTPVAIKSIVKVHKQRVYKTIEEVTKFVNDFCENCPRWRAQSFAEHIGVSALSLNLLNIGYNYHANCMSFPMRDSNFDHVGVRYRFFNGKKRSLKGGREGLFIPNNIRCSRFETMYIVEGPTDTAALLTMGVYAIGRPNCTGGNKEISELVDKFPFHKYIIVADQDKPGKDGAKRLLGIMPAGTKLIAPKYHKDVREYYRSFYNSKNAIRAILNTDSDYWEVLA